MASASSCTTSARVVGFRRRPPIPLVDNLKVARFERLRLQVDQNNDVMAYR